MQSSPPWKRLSAGTEVVGVAKYSSFARTEFALHIFSPIWSNYFHSSLLLVATSFSVLAACKFNLRDVVVEPATTRSTMIKAYFDHRRSCCRRFNNQKKLSSQIVFFLLLNIVLKSVIFEWNYKQTLLYINIQNIYETKGITSGKNNWSL